MDAFENVVAGLLEREGYWVRTSFKVELTKAEKRRIGRHSSPRWEIDLIAYRPPRTLLAIECKSFLDSRGVISNHLLGEDRAGAKRYKLFNERGLRTVVFRALVRQLTAQKACLPHTEVQLCLAAGRFANDDDRETLARHFKKMGWGFFDRKWLMGRLRDLAESAYSNDVVAVVSKLLLKRGGMPDEDTELRDEYDFSGGVRGKYAKRCAKGVTIVRTPEPTGQRDVPLPPEGRRAYSPGQRPGNAWAFQYV